MEMRVCAMKLWLGFLLTAWTLLHRCSAFEPYVITSYEIIPNDTLAELSSGPGVAVNWEMERDLWNGYFQRKYFYAHNETLIAMARAEAEATRRRDGDRAASTLYRIIPRSSTFPDFAPSDDGCRYDNAERDLSFYSGNVDTDSGDEVWNSTHSDFIEILAVDSCAGRRTLEIGNEYLEYCSHRWAKPEHPDNLIQENPDPLARSFKVLARICAFERHREKLYEVLGEGVYVPATGTMHLLACSRKQHPFVNFSALAPADDFGMMSSKGYPYDGPAGAPAETYALWRDPDAFHQPPLNSSTPEDCAISVTVQYPPLNARWNSDRVVMYAIRSQRAKDDPLYFEPFERSAFFPYLRRYFEVQDQSHDIQLQRRLEMGGRILLLVLGLVCLALQIEHGRHNEEALPFVSQVMLGIQLANHVSQTSIFKDLQIGGYYSGDNDSYYGGDRFRYPDSVAEYEYYGTMAWSEHIPYQAMAMAAIFMYVWIFHRVGDRRRVMQLRVLRKRPGATDPPSDWRVMYATLAFFSLLCFLGFFAIGQDPYGHVRRALTGLTAAQERSQRRSGGGTYYFDLDAPPVVHRPESPFVSWRFYALSYAQWGFVNKLTGLVVSFFLVPQLLGNVQWEVQGRPLSAWFYAGIPLLQSLPHVFSIAKHFQLLPIFSFYDPYLNSLYGIYVNPTTWWQIGVVVCSTLQVLAVHSQFSRSLTHSANSRHSRPKPSAIQMAEIL